MLRYTPRTSKALESSQEQLLDSRGEVPTFSVCPSPIQAEPYGLASLTPIFLGVEEAVHSSPLSSTDLLF